MVKALWIQRQLKNKEPDKWEVRMVDVGEKAPAFKAPIGGGGLIALQDLKGKKVVLYFYPKDDTPGCTAEAKDFADLKRKFSANGIAVVGVSKDSVAKHDRFAENTVCV
jgi:peroxiredoxin Q/BCP